MQCQYQGCTNIGVHSCRQCGLLVCGKHVEMRGGGITSVPVGRGYPEYMTRVVGSPEVPICKKCATAEALASAAAAAQRARESAQHRAKEKKAIGGCLATIGAGVVLFAGFLYLATTFSSSDTLSTMGTWTFIVLFVALLIFGVVWVERSRR